LVIIDSITFSEVHEKKPRIGSVAGAGFLVFCLVVANASGRHPAPAADKQQRKGYENIADGSGLHTMLWIAPQVFGDCQRHLFERRGVCLSA
jgi:hypothetical protein